MRTAAGQSLQRWKHIVKRDCRLLARIFKLLCLQTYYRPMRYELVDMEALLNAAQVVEPASEIQFCPDAL